ncbi:MAG: hypothetical protein IJK36_01765 [Bacteroidales bacterium]|nr:hypothetical protein [Bacteroidales bacterium]
MSWIIHLNLALTIRNSGKDLDCGFFCKFAAIINTTNHYESKKPYLRSRNPAFRSGLHWTINQQQSNY